MDNMDLLTDAEVYALKTSVAARKNRIRTLVKMGRVSRTEYDALNNEENAVIAELDRRGLPHSPPPSDQPF